MKQNITLSLILGGMLVAPVSSLQARSPWERQQINRKIEKSAQILTDNLHSMQLYNNVVGIGEGVDALTRALRILTMTQPDENVIKFWGTANIVTSAVIIAAKLLIGSADPESVAGRFALSIPNILDCIQGCTVVSAAKKIAQNNKKRKEDQSIIQGVLLALIALEEGIAAKNRFDLTNWNAYKAHTNPMRNKNFTKRMLINRFNRTIPRKLRGRLYTPHNAKQECKKQLKKKNKKIVEHIASTGSFFVWIIRFITEAIFINNLKKPVSSSYSPSTTYHSNNYSNHGHGYSTTYDNGDDFDDDDDDDYFLND